jgi:hypothetical protein
MNRTVSDWIKFHCGDIVRKRDNPRHVGRIEAINRGVTAIVKWRNGWIEAIDTNELEMEGP